MGGQYSYTYPYPCSTRARPVREESGYIHIHTYFKLVDDLQRHIIDHVPFILRGAKELLDRAREPDAVTRCLS